MEHLVEITTSHKFSDEDINDLMVTALEGGINYWCGKARIKEGSISAEEREKIKYTSDAISVGGVLELTDVEDPSEIWELTHEKLLKGIKMHCTKANIAPADLMDNHDAGDADCIVQYALFDKIEFG